MDRRVGKQNKYNQINPQSSIVKSSELEKFFKIDTLYPMDKYQSLYGDSQHASNLAITASLKQADKKIAKLSKINPNFYEDFIPVRKEETTQPVIYHF